ncbi:MAG: exodeoxyribonuclease VII large subunit, partial [Myxococcales bacterium]|nr:exodeoxyribonuclease VII large subunit [Myxococcales bacterium]
MARAQRSLFDRDGPPTGRPPPRVLTVSQLVRGADRCLGDHFARVHVEGEVSNLRIVGSGHAYFTLKDREASLPVALWRSALARLRFRITDGLALRVVGRLGVYPAQGKFQLYAEGAEPAGLGAMMLQLEQLKEKLRAEGLFAAERKRPLPRWPRRIGVVTSATGAAVHDIITVARRRCPSRILLSPALVQGDGAPASLTRALRRLWAMPEVDVIILGRGGGAREDLWAFNDEGLARTVAESPVPVVSAVGHEIDVTICDLVADLRAATPSHAAEHVVPDRAVFVEQLRELDRRLRLSLRRQVMDERARLELASHRLASHGARLVDRPRRRLVDLRARLEQHHPRRLIDRDRRQLSALHARLVEQHPRHRIAAARAQLERTEATLAQAGQSLTTARRQRLALLAARLQGLSPLAVLERGYA